MIDLPTPITPDILSFIRAQYRLRWNGIHGYSHWQRVCENGLRLAELTGADLTIVALFAYTHDMARHDDGFDRGHGPRAAQIIQDTLQPQFLNLPEPQLAQLTAAVSLHTGSYVHEDITVLTCWDADRLDLGRIGVRPNPRYLCTDAARDPELITWGFLRSQGGSGSWDG